MKLSTLLKGALLGLGMYLANDKINLSGLDNMLISQYNRQAVKEYSESSFLYRTNVSTKSAINDGYDINEDGIKDVIITTPSTDTIFLISDGNVYRKYWSKQRGFPKTGEGTLRFGGNEYVFEKGAKSEDEKDITTPDGALFLRNVTGIRAIYEHDVNGFLSYYVSKGDHKKVKEMLDDDRNVSWMATYQYSQPFVDALSFLGASHEYDHGDIKNVMERYRQHSNQPRYDAVRDFLENNGAEAIAKGWHVEFNCPPGNP